MVVFKFCLGIESIVYFFVVWVLKLICRKVFLELGVSRGRFFRKVVVRVEFVFEIYKV